MYSQPMHLSLELILRIQITRGRVDCYGDSAVKITKLALMFSKLLDMSLNYETITRAKNMTPVRRTKTVEHCGE